MSISKYIAQMEKHKVHFKPQRKTVYVSPGTTLLSAAVDSNIKIRHTCGGQATCGTCRVLIEQGQDNLSPIVKREIDLLGEERLQKGYRLACQSKVKGPVVAQVYNWLRLPLQDANVEPPTIADVVYNNAS